MANPLCAPSSRRVALPRRICPCRRGPLLRARSLRIIAAAVPRAASGAIAPHSGRGLRLALAFAFAFAFAQRVIAIAREPAPAFAAPVRPGDVQVVHARLLAEAEMGARIAGAQVAPVAMHALRR